MTFDLETFDLEAIGRGLAFADCLPALGAAVRDAGVVVVQAPPGTGKTTLVPPAVAAMVPGRVVVTQPRRVAARAAAARLAQLSGTRLGEAVGYTVRGERRAGPRTRVEMVTAGVQLRRMLSDPEQADVGAVVIDEVHERAIESDLVLGMCAELRQMRSDLVLVVMSATLDAARWSTLLGGAPVVSAESVLFPMEVRWEPMAGARLDARGVSRAFVAHVAEVCAEQWRQRSQAGDGDANVLAFMPGAREVDAVVAALRDRGVVADPLHGSLDARAQDAALRADGPARVIVATSVAETSLTVPGVRVVVDSGLSREPRRDAARGMTGLVTVSESRASAQQRAGRAARLGPGTVVRCFPQSEWAGMRPDTTPEIQTADLTQTALDLAAWGSPGGRGLPLPDLPPEAALAEATATLQGLGALDADGRATAEGRRLARLPVEPRLGRALLDAGADVGVRTAAEAVALIASDQRVPDADVEAAWRRGRASGAPWTREADRLERLARSMSPRDREEHAARPRAGQHDGTRGIGLVVATAYPDRIARRRAQASHEQLSSEYLLASGTAASLPSGSPLHLAEWLAVSDVARTPTGAVIRAAAPLDPEDARRAAQHLLTEATEAEWNGRKVTARRVSRLGAIALASTPVAPSPDDGRRAVAAAMSSRGLREVVGWPESAEQLRRRVALLHHTVGEPWPRVDDAGLLASVDLWLGPELDRLARGASPDSLDLTLALRRVLPWPEAARLEELVPERLEVPTGSRIRLAYPEDPGERVVLAVKLQEMFGQQETPRLVDGRVPVLIHLLSPAGRPLAVTDDLASFWVNAYPAVRAENRGRYSKHPWPEDPLTATAMRGVKRRS